MRGPRSWCSCLWRLATRTPPPKSRDTGNPWSPYTRWNPPSTAKQNVKLSCFLKGYRWPVVKELCPVLGVSGGAEDVHHHEVLDVELLPPRLFQLVNIVPEIRCKVKIKIAQGGQNLQILSIFLIIGRFTAISSWLLDICLQVKTSRKYHFDVQLPQGK